MNMTRYLGANLPGNMVLTADTGSIYVTPNAIRKASIWFRVMSLALEARCWLLAAMSPQRQAYTS